MSKPNNPIDSENTPTPGGSTQQSLRARVGAWMLGPQVAWIVLLLTLLITLLAWKNAQEALLQAQQVQFENRAEEVSTAILKRMQGYEQVLRGGVGLFAASESVSRTTWRDYVASLKTQEQYPGIQGIGFSAHIPAARLDAHLRTVRAEGFPDYAIRPAGVRAEYTSIIYLEPLDWRNQRTIGFDMFSEANRRAAMERARDTGGTAISKKLTLSQEDGKDVQPGMLMYLPYYKNGAPRHTLEERRANLLGYVYSPFRLNDLMHGILDKKQAGAEPDIDIEVYDGTLRSADSLLYDDDGIAHALGKPDADRLTLTRDIDLYGHTWSLYFTSRPVFHAAFDKNKPLFILAVGMLLSVMLSGLIWTFATQRRRALEISARLGDSERRVRALLDNLVEGIVHISETGIIEMFNPAAERLFGYRSFDVIGKNVSMLMPEPYHSEHDAYLGRYLHTGQAHIIGTAREVTAKRSNGSVFPIELRVSEFSLEGRRQFIGGIHDITERKQVEIEILRISDLLRGSINALYDAFVIYDPQDRLVLCNDKYREIYSEAAHLLVPGAQFEDIIRAGAEMGQYAAAIGRVDEWVAERMAAHLAANTTVIQKHSNGRTLRIVERRLPDGHIVGSRVDISESIRAQDEILRLNAGLEERVMQRTEELRQSNEELEEAAQMLKEKNNLLAEQKIEVEHKNREIEAARLMLEERAEQLVLTSKYKSEFLSSMSHELRTPLNSLLILSQLLAENPEHNMSEQQIEYAKIIQGAGKDLLALISDILDLSKIESGTVTPDLQDDTFANVSAQVERAFRHVAESRGLGFGVELAPGLPPSLYTDAQRLQQVIRNLLSNAFKFTEKGWVSLRIAAVESGWSADHDGLNRAGAVIGFYVTDTGIGLPTDKQKLIFEAFQQADAGTARKYGGTGLGLTISREIARLLGGELRLAMSSPGQGSTFVLYLPLRAPESGQVGRSAPGGAPGNGQRLERDGESFAPKAARPDAAAQEAPQGSMPQETIHQPSAALDDRAAIKPGERTLLIIEDDARFAGILLRAARDKGFKGIVAARGDDGLKLAGALKPTAITLDLHLPDMDGWVVLERLKRNPDTRHIPVEIISGEDNRPRGLRYGAFKYLVKPVTAESLQKALADVNKFSERAVKDLLVADGDEQHRNTVLDLIGSADVRIEAVASGKHALASLKKKRYDCIVLDLNLPDIPVADLLEAIQGFDLTRDVPVIIYGVDELAQKEQARLKSLALKGIVKAVRTPERLLDETALFLHRVVSKLPEERRQMLEKLYLSADSLAGKKVLLVDDDVRNIFALTAVLEHHKMVVTSAENGRDALEELGKNQDVEIVLMDIMMPEMDGFETMRQIRQMKQFESLPMIALTAKAMKGDREKCIEAGASDYVIKPVDTDQLLSLLRVWLYR